MTTTILHTHNSLDAEFRQIINDQQDCIRSLKAEIQLLKKIVAEEQEQKYRAYVKIADLQKRASQAS